MVFYAGLNYDNPFIIKELAKESEGEVNCPVENTKKYKFFSVPVAKEVKKYWQKWRKKEMEKWYLTNYNILIAQDITDASNKHAERVCKDFEILMNDMILYVQSDTLLLANVFNDFPNIYLKIYELWSCSFAFCTRVSMESILKINQSKIRSMNWYRYVINGRKRYQRWNI